MRSSSILARSDDFQYSVWKCRAASFINFQGEEWLVGKLGSISEFFCSCAQNVLKNDIFEFMCPPSRGIQHIIIRYIYYIFIKIR